MMNFGITDRRKNPSGKSLGNRKRFIDRVKKNIDVSKGLKERKISDTGDQEVTINKDGIEEHHFHYDRKKGNWDYLLPGNKKYNVGDGIPRQMGVLEVKVIKVLLMVMAKMILDSPSVNKNIWISCLVI